tara:strand:+ start:411 stop:566 length:156 start_codon:yes stop_codon:yes gene_type:complete
LGTFLRASASAADLATPYPAEYPELLTAVIETVGWTGNTGDVNRDSIIYIM